MGYRRVAGVVGWARAREEAVLKVSHDPRAASSTGAPGGVVTIVDGLHVAVARIGTADLGVAVVKAAGTVVMGSVEHCVHALRFITCSRAAGGVVAVARAGRHEHAVGLLAV